MSKFRMISAGLLASAAIFGLHIVAAQADDDAGMKAAKDYIAQAAAPVTAWTGPTTGPKAQGKKLVIYVSADQRNGGAQGVGDGAQEAAKALGWDFRILDGQGSVPARTSALTQAIALKPDGIILGTVDAAEQAPRPTSFSSPIRSMRSRPPRPTLRRPPSRRVRAARCWGSKTRRSATSPTGWDS